MEVIKKNGIKFGLLLGIFSILATTLMYTIDLKLFVNIWIGLVLFFVSLSIGIVSVAQSKKQIGGFITFKEAFTAFFITMAIGLALNILFSILLFNVIDPNAALTIRENIVEYTVNMLQKAGTPAAKIKEQIETMRSTNSYSIGNQIQSYFWFLLFYIIVGLLVAVALRNKTSQDK
jgi:hypothetical protein